MTPNEEAWIRNKHVWFVENEKRTLSIKHLSQSEYKHKESIDAN